MPRETVRDKASRYLVEGRVIVLESGKHGCAAHVRGEGAVYVVRWFGDWTCSCPHPNRSTSCSHVTACKRILAPDLSRGTDASP